MYALSVIASPLSAQTVRDGVHTDATGPSNLCGVAGADALAIREKLRADPSITKKPSGSKRFEAYFSVTEAKQWTVTTKADVAYPAVTCVSLYNSGAGTEMQRDMRCDASRKRCDALFSEFEANDERIRKSLKGR
jgi:hypothetical protein